MTYLQGALPIMTQAEVHGTVISLKVGPNGPPRGATSYGRTDGRHACDVADTTGSADPRSWLAVNVSSRSSGLRAGVHKRQSDVINGMKCVCRLAAYTNRGVSHTMSTKTSSGITANSSSYVHRHSFLIQPRRNVIRLLSTCGSTCFNATYAHELVRRAN